jgi:hypothetical protein
MDPIKLARVIHHDHHRGRQAAQAWQASNQASVLATRKQIEPTAGPPHMLGRGLGGEVGPQRVPGADVEEKGSHKLWRSDGWTILSVNELPAGP